jgi:hypothetical protein
MRLHVLIDYAVCDPAASVRGALAKSNIQGEVETTRASLEDVFVAATLPKSESAANGAA